MWCNKAISFWRPQPTLEALQRDTLVFLGFCQWPKPEEPNGDAGSSAVLTASSLSGNTHPSISKRLSQQLVARQSVVELRQQVRFKSIRSKFKNNTNFFFNQKQETTTSCEKFFCFFFLELTSNSSQKPCLTLSVVSASLLSSRTRLSISAALIRVVLRGWPSSAVDVKWRKTTSKKKRKS